VAFGYAADVLPGEPVLLDLPAHDPSAAALSYEILEPPTQATLERGANAWLLRPAADATGVETLTFRALTGTIASEPARVKLRYCGAVEIVEAPSSAKICPGRVAELSVAARGERLAYQWLKDGTSIEGAIGPTWTVADFGPEDVGEYAVEITRWCGEVVQRTRSPVARVELETRPETCRSYAWLPYLGIGGD
jgi:hypothetical protein